MAGGRGRGARSARGAAPGRRGRSASVASSSMPAESGTPGAQLCGTCCRDVGDKAIGCDECETWVHNTEMCSGLSMDMIQAIDRYEGAGIKFVCTKCRLDFSAKRGGSPSSSTEMHLVELVKHLSQQMMGICSVVQQLKAEICMIRQPESALTNSTNQTINQPTAHVPMPPDPNLMTSASGAKPLTVSGPPSPEYRKVVREELRELQEQQKRRASLVIRGLGADSAGAAVRAFEEVTEFLIDQKVTLTDVVRIPSESDLYRGKVADDATRKLILDRAKQLKDAAQFGTVFIRRDLTFKQRSELRMRREAAALTTSSNRPGGPRSTQSRELVPNPAGSTPEQHPKPGNQQHNSLSVEGTHETIPKRIQSSQTPQSNALA